MQTCVGPEKQMRCTGYINEDCQINMDCNAHHSYDYKRCVGGSCKKVFERGESCKSSDECGKGYYKLFN